MRALNCCVLSTYIILCIVFLSHVILINYIQCQHPSIAYLNQGLRKLFLVTQNTRLAVAGHDHGIAGAFGDRPLSLSALSLPQLMLTSINVVMEVENSW